LARHREQNSRVCKEKKSTSLCANSECFCYDERERRERSRPGAAFIFMRPKLCERRRKLAYSRNEKSEKTAKLRSTLILPLYLPPAKRSRRTLLGWKLREILGVRLAPQVNSSAPLRRKKCDVASTLSVCQCRGLSAL
jgi:hypothetical protein